MSSPKHIQGTTVPDKQLTHYSVSIGRGTYHGWGEELPSLESAPGMSKSSLDAHTRQLKHINDMHVNLGHKPFSVHKVMRLYGPERVLVHLKNNDNEQLAMSYNTGFQTQANLRQFHSPTTGVTKSSMLRDSVSLIKPWKNREDTWTKDNFRPSRKSW
jgi:hypothetical protein